jgi:methylated-DNA-[protein]-cysteine S-methyltransferase
MDKQQQATVFYSALGWMALTVNDRVVKRLSFGHATPQEALADVGANGELTDESSELTDESGELADDARELSALVRRLQQYAEGVEDDFLDVEVEDADLTPFGRRVVNICRRIPFGSTLTYGELAEQAGHPRAARAVGNCMRTNRVPLIVPCHRVVGSGGAMRGYSAGEGVRMKLRLLEMESAASSLSAL